MTTPRSIRAKDLKINGQTLTGEGTTATTFVISSGATGGKIQFGPAADNNFLQAYYDADAGNMVYRIGGTGDLFFDGSVNVGSVNATSSLYAPNVYGPSVWTDNIKANSNGNGVTIGSVKFSFAVSGNVYKGAIFSPPTSGVDRYSLWVDQPSGGTTNVALVVEGGSTISNSTPSVKIQGNGALLCASNGGIMCGSGTPGGYGAIRAGSVQMSGGSGLTLIGLNRVWYSGTGSNADDGSIGLSGFAHSVGATAPVHKIWNSTSGVNNVPTKMQFQAMGTGTTILELCKPGSVSGTTLYTDNPLRVTRTSTGATVDLLDSTADQLLTFTNSHATYDLKVSFDVKAIGFFGATPTAKQTVTLTGTAATDIAAIKTALVNLGLIA
jgi:hypothetical protein